MTLSTTTAPMLLVVITSIVGKNSSLTNLQLFWEITHVSKEYSGVSKVHIRECLYVYRTLSLGILEVQVEKALGETSFRLVKLAI